jgi:signal peptidase I
VFGGVVAGLLLIVTVTAGVGFYEVEGASMTGSYAPGDLLLVESLSLWLTGGPGRFDCVVIDDPEHPGAEMLKRVVGLPGERIELDRGALIVDGKPVEMPGSVHGAASAGPVPTGNGYFVVGDNMEHSRDSRRFGMVARSRLAGRVVMTLFKAKPGSAPEKNEDDVSLDEALRGDEAPKEQK